MKKSLVALAVVSAVSFMSSTAFAGNPHISNPNPEPLTVVNSISDVNGYVGGQTATDILYPIAGSVNATVTNMRTGETIGTVSQTGEISATVMFPFSFMGLMGDWSVLPATLPWTMDNDFSMNIGGSTFAIANVESVDAEGNVREENYRGEFGGLTGRAFVFAGPVENPMATGTMALRMAGCAGVVETSDEGDYAGKVGSICMNGTFSFDQDWNGKGVSNCTLAIHTPLGK